MKRSFFLLALLVLLSYGSLSSPVIEFQDYNIRKGETAIATITTNGTFTQKLTSDQISFFQGRKEIFIESEIYFYNNTYYLAIYPSILGNVTMRVSNLLYSENSSLKSMDPSVELSILEPLVFSKELNKTVEEVLSIRPGVFYSAAKPKLKIVNKGGISLNISFLGNQTTLDPMNTINIDLEPSEVLSWFRVDSYKSFFIPVIYLSAGNNTFSAPVTKDLRLSEKVIYDYLILGNISNKTIQLFNFGTENITNLNISVDNNITSIEQVSYMGAKEVKNLSIVTFPEFGGHISSIIYFNYTQYNKSWSLEVPISIYVLPKNNTGSNFFSDSETCEDLNGTICPEDCSGNATFTKDGSYCCLGKCIAKVNPFEDKSSSSGGKGIIWGIVILVVLGIIGFLFYKKYKKGSSQKPDEQLKKTIERLSPTQTIIQQKK